MDRITLKLSVPRETPDVNWEGWDLETFYLREHLLGLIQAYGLKILKSELSEVERTWDESD